MNEIVEAFFNFDCPCPKEIPLCEKVRQAYLEEVGKASQSGCSQCAKNNIKAKYLQAIWKEAVTSLTSKVSS